MMAKQIEGVPIPGEVWAYARLFGVEDHLPAVLQTARRAFPGGAISMALEQLLPGLGFHFLVVQVGGVNEDEQQIRDARDDYFRSLLTLLGDKAAHFRLQLGEPPAEEPEPLNLEKPPAVSDEVWTFAVKWRLAKALLAVLEMTRNVFPGCEPVLELEDDPELAGDRYIVVNVRGMGMDVPDAVKARKAWCAGLRSACPGQSAHVFRLRLEMPQ
jgi:hypothetical protein